MTELAQVPLCLHPVKVAELARALRIEPGVMPPTATVLAAHDSPPGRSANELIIAAAGMDPRRVLLGQLSWTFPGTLRPGDELRGHVHYQGSTARPSRRGGTVVIARGRTDWYGQKYTGNPVVTTDVSLIEAQAATPASTRADDAGRNETPPPAIDAGQLRLSRTDIVRYAGAAGDFNPVHHDEPYARSLGYPSVFAMGLLPAGILAGVAGGSIGFERIATVSTRFDGPVWPDLTYDIRALPDVDGRTRLELRNPDGAAVLHVAATAKPSGG